MEMHQICGHCGKSLGVKTFKDQKRLYYHEGRWITQQELLPQDESITSSSICSEPSMDTQSHASIELHNEGDGMTRSEERSPIESSSLGLGYDYLSDADTGTESQGNYMNGPKPVCVHINSTYGLFSAKVHDGLIY